jgi:hypothetical protein
MRKKARSLFVSQEPNVKPPVKTANPASRLLKRLRTPTLRRTRSKNSVRSTLRYVGRSSRLLALRIPCSLEGRIPLGCSPDNSESWSIFIPFVKSSATHYQAQKGTEACPGAPCGREYVSRYSTGVPPGIDGQICTVLCIKMSAWPNSAS